MKRILKHTVHLLFGKLCSYSAFSLRSRASSDSRGVEICSYALQFLNYYLQLGNSAVVNSSPYFNQWNKASFLRNMLPL